MPFTISRQGKVLYLTLDTPGCAVNIFNQRCAEQLLSLLPQLNPTTTQAVVFQSAKADSFINGVGLLLIQAARSRERIQAAADVFRRAYQAVRDCAMPTIAVVRGNCWGCGLEFLLNCRHRLAVDTPSTNFFMTEIVHYLLVPTFEGVHHLPLQAGPAERCQSLALGRRWTGERAYREGLVNEIADDLDGSRDSRLPLAMDDFVRRVLDGKVDSCLQPERFHHWTAKDALFHAATLARIDRLPPIYQPVYRDCLDQMRRALQKTRLDAEDFELLREAEARSILAPAGKATHAFFFIRQIAEERFGREMIVARDLREAGSKRAADCLLAAYLRPLTAFLATGSGMQNVNFTLREFGFLNWPHVLLRDVAVESMAQLLNLRGPEAARILRQLQDDRYTDGLFSQDLLDALLVSLLAAVWNGLTDGSIVHPAWIDVMARDLLDFPLIHTSLCKYLNKARVAELLGRSGRFRGLVAAEVLAAAERCLTLGKEFYV